MTPEELIEKAEDLGSPPDIIHRMQRVINASHSSATDIAGVIQTDGPLSARLLKLANSALFSLDEPVDSVARAVTMIGTRQVHALAMAASIIDHFKNIDTGFFNSEVFWRHSLAVACTARSLAQVAGDPNPEQLFLCGVLHDIGRLCMLVHCSEDMIRSIKKAYEHREPLLITEMQTFGWDHTTVAKALLETWNLPSLVVQPVVRHHAPGASIHSCILHVADAIVHGLDIGSSGEHIIPPLQEKAWDLIGLKPSGIKQLVTFVDRSYPQLEQLLLGSKAAA